MRDCLTAEVLLARSLLSATQEDLAGLIREVKQALGVPLVGVISDGQPSIRCAVGKALPEVPHQLCHFHSLREAAKPVYEADGHAKRELKKRVRGVRPIERQLDQRMDPEAEVMRGYCSAVRSALTDDGHPPLAASGLKLHDRLTGISQSLERVTKRGLAQAPRPAASDPPTGLDRDGRPVARSARRLSLGPSGGPRPHQRGPTPRGGRETSPGRLAGRDDAAPGCRWGPRSGPGKLPESLTQLLAGLFHCYEIPALPRTNNALEQSFGAHRYHERRATGRKGASPALVLRGSVQLIAAMATRLRVFAAWELAPEDVSDWQALRHELETRRQRRTLRRRFRRDPDSYLGGA